MGASREEMVIQAVQRYVSMRQKELTSGADTAGGSETGILLATKPSDITLNSSWDDLGFDELDTVEVLLEVEEEFDHIIPDDDADNITSIKGTLEYFREKC